MKSNQEIYDMLKGKLMNVRDEKSAEEFFESLQNDQEGKYIIAGLALIVIMEELERGLPGTVYDMLVDQKKTGSKEEAVAV